jgi:F0F1-type ATP synthase assembly protein I
MQDQKAVSELETNMRKARAVAFGIVAAQQGLTLLVAGAGWALAGLRFALSACLGGGIGTLASLHMALTMFGPGADKEPGKLLRRLYRGEFFKLVITGGMFSVALLYLDVSFGAMLGGFAATLIAYWLALGLRLAD